MLFSRYRSTYITPPSAFSVNPEARLPAIHFHVVWPADLDLAVYVLFRALRSEPEARVRHGNYGDGNAVAIWRFWRGRGINPGVNQGVAVCSVYDNMRWTNRWMMGRSASTSKSSISSW